MNILIYTRNQISPLKGGTERVAYLLAEYLMGKNQVFFMALYPTDLPQAIETEMLPDNSNVVSSENIQKIRSFIREKEINVVVNEDGYGLGVEIFSHKYIPANVKIISHIHYDPLTGSKHYFRRIYLPLSFNIQGLINLIRWIKAPYNKMKLERDVVTRMNTMADNSDNVIVLSPIYIKELKKNFSSENREKIIAISNPLTFNSHEVDNSLKINEILYVGRLDYEPKRVDRILRAWRHVGSMHPDWQLSIIGDGEDRERLEKLSKKFKLRNVEFTGLVNPEPYYRRAKILLLTSNFEGTPMVISEAMSYGVVPVVMNTFPAASDMIDSDYNGLLTKPFKIKDLINTVDRVISDGEYFESLSSNARMTIANIDNNQVFKQWERLINQDSKR